MNAMGTAKLDYMYEKTSTDLSKYIWLLKENGKAPPTKWNLQ